jgi:hypothetical protein
MKDELIKKVVGHVDSIFDDLATVNKERESIKKDIVKKTSEYGVVLGALESVKKAILEGKRELAKETSILEKERKDLQKTQQAWAIKYASQIQEEKRLKSSVEALLSEEKRAKDSIVATQPLEAMKGYLEEEVKNLSKVVDESKDKAFIKKKAKEEEILVLNAEIKKAKETLLATTKKNEEALKFVIPSKLDIEKREVAVQKKEQNLKIIEGRYNNKYMVKGTKFKL